ncbi:MAG: HAMP domain-containing histidine kinase [Chloroflexi bacterium]|nr:HAMP domain-containing histidine kinase [Chloroflexota bacterium]
MLNTLRNRLLASYLAILIITLLIIAVALVVFLRSRPIPTDDIENELTAKLLDLRVIEALPSSNSVVTNLQATLLDVPVQEALPAGPRRLQDETDEQTVWRFLRDEAGALDVRLLLATEQSVVYFDSAQEIETGSAIDELEREPLVRQGQLSTRMASAFQGRFADSDGEEWIYVSQVLPGRFSPGESTHLYLIVAEPAPAPEDTTQRVVGYLEEAAAERSARILLTTLDGEVRFDSSNAYLPEEIVFNLEQNELIPPTPGRPAAMLFKGQFQDPDGTEWLYVSQTWDIGPDPLQIMVAEESPEPTLSEVFRAFGDEFFSPLAQAGLFGLLVALGLSALIARSVARPLQQMSRATQAIAQGNFNPRVPEAGPREVRALAQSFNDMVERVSITQAAQRDFLANVSHDLRTPLTSIQGFSQAIMEGVAADPDTAQNAARIIYDEAGRLHRMVEDLLDMARIEAGRMDMRRQIVRLADLLQAVGDSLSVKAGEKGLTLEHHIPDDLPRIAGDGDRLAQVFTNLLDNAIKHTPPGGTVTLEAETERHRLVVAVRDTGEGIPAEDLSRVFERFYQVDKSRKRDRKTGTGLGLAITRQIVESHGGTIQVASKVGEGTIFTVYLPLPAPDMTTINIRHPG